MTKLTITRERMEEIRDYDTCVTLEESAELARMALAAMDSEPVGYFGRFDPDDEDLIDQCSKNVKGSFPLYLHAQPALTPYAWSYDWARCVTCEGPQDFEPVIEREPPSQWAIDEGRVKNLITLYRTAQPAPVVPEDVLEALQKVARIRLDMNDFDGDRRGIADCLGDAEEALIEVVNRRAAMLQAGNSPVIPEGYVMVPKEPTDEMIAAAMNCDDVLFNSDESFCVQFGNIYEAMLAAAPTGIAINSNGWIPVSGRMPETNKFVLVSNGVWVGQGLYDDSEHLESDEHWQDEHREFINVLHHPVTHWMPLPAAPQEINHVRK